MNAVRIWIVAMLVTAVAAGIGLYYMQVYALYDEVEPTGPEDVQLTSLISGQPEPIVFENFTAIDSDSSPIRYRACFDTALSQATLSETYVSYEGAEPLNGPAWFDCYDAREIGEALERGEALAFLGEANITYGVDRVVAVMPDGRGRVWHQLNRCGQVVFDGEPAPEDCPEPPEGY